MSEFGRAEIDKFFEALVADEDLRAWFMSFEGIEEEARQGAFVQLVKEMRQAEEHPELIQATVLLAHPEVYETVRQALEEKLAER